MMATVKPIGAILVFGVTWGLWALFGWYTNGLSGFASVLLLLPVFLFALIAISERGILVLAAIRGFSKSRSFANVYGQVQHHRRAVVEAVARAA
jgi:ABC-type dipeptide/oligopeptide/nickel transport system permease subunit